MVQVVDCNSFSDDGQFSLATFPLRLTRFDNGVQTRSDSGDIAARRLRDQIETNFIATHGADYRNLTQYFESLLLGGISGPQLLKLDRRFWITAGKGLAWGLAGALGLFLTGPEAAGVAIGWKVAGLFGLGFDASVIGDILDDLAEPGCFTADTPVATQHGFKSIEAIRSGDMVIAQNEASDEITLEPVLRTWAHHDHPIVRLVLDNGEMLRTTVYHRFLVTGRGFIPVSSLIPGDRVKSRSGEDIGVACIGFTSEYQDVYNLTVANAHTYFVGRTQLWVHNVKVIIINTPDNPLTPM